MKIEQIYTGCLAQGAYYITSDKEAVIIDPLREIQPYLDRAKNDNVEIKYIFESHFHADFVSGHIDLAKATGATIVYGPTAQPAFSAHIATDGEEFKVGKVTFKVLHTPGHTMESACFLLKDEEGKDYALFSGDTLFIGDVGRPDLAQKATSLTKEQLAGLLFKSLRNKIMPLADEIILYPAHGAGSACGKHMSSETISTIGNQKKVNYALRANMTEEEFIKEVTNGLLPPPGYFGMNVFMNKNGYDSINEVMIRGLHPLSVDEFESVANESGALLLDTRDPQKFSEGFIPNSINIGLGGTFAPWVGAMIPDVKQNILLITEPGNEEESIKRLARVGYDFVIGYLNGGFPKWVEANNEIETVQRINAESAISKIETTSPLIIDLRRVDEFAKKHFENALNVPLEYINSNLSQFPKDKFFIIHCAGGYRSMIAASILKARGWNNFADIAKGIDSIPVSKLINENQIDLSQKTS